MKNKSYSTVDCKQSYTYPTLPSLRSAFWEAHPDLKNLYRKSYKHNEYNATIRSHWSWFVDSCERNGDISHALATRATNPLINHLINHTMTTINLTIGANDCTILSFRTKQKGYGRQWLYVTLGTLTSTYNDVYVCDVYPNVLEHFRSYILREDAFPSHEEKGVYTDAQGNGHYTEGYICDNTIDLLNKALQDTVVEIEVEEDDNNDPIEVLQPFIENFVKSARELSDKLQELSDIHIGDSNELMFMDGAPSPNGNDVHEYINMLISWAESGIYQTFKQQ